jgi:molecular chaperone GrpE
MEKRISEKIEKFEEEIKANLSGRFEWLDERLQQSVRQDRRNQAALESLFENQQAELSMLRGIRNESKALNVLMAFAESFVLWCRSQPDSPEFRVLWAKLSDLLDLFSLEIFAEAGVSFDPSLHEACAVHFNPDMPEGCVLEIVRPGFASGGKVLRCASVVINRFPVMTETSVENETDDATDGEMDVMPDGREGEFEGEAETDDRIGV